MCNSSYCRIETYIIHNSPIFPIFRLHICPYYVSFNLLFYNICYYCYLTTLYYLYVYYIYFFPLNKYLIHICYVYVYIYINIKIHIISFMHTF